MRAKISLLPALAATVVMVLITACVTVDTTSGTPTPTLPRQSPTSTPIPPEARQTAVEFARSHQAIEQDWDQFRTDFNQWRASLVSCDRAAAEVALRDFVSEFNSVLQRARNLPRSSSTRGLADQLIEAVGNEGEALRQLSDRWQPGNTALFSAVEAQRSAAAAAQQEVLNRLMDLSESPAAPESAPAASADEAREFSQAFEQVNQSWEQFHNDYNSLLNQQDSLGPAEISTRLSNLADEFSSLVSAVNSLPSSGATGELVTQLKEAAQAEDTALKELLDSFQGPAETPPAQTETLPGQTDTPRGGEGAAGSSGEGSAPSDSNDPFVSMNNRVEESDGVREQVQDALQNIMDDASAGNLSDIDNFRQQYDALVREWDEFHQKYDQWRSSEGGCNRTEVIERLGEFSVRFGEIARRVRNLPRDSFVRPMAETLVEAAEREEEALRVLRNTWRPFATNVFHALDEERTNADRLRRHAETGIEELLERFDIPPSEI